MSSPSFCATVPTNFTDTDMVAVYGSPTSSPVTGILANTVIPLTARDSTGILTTTYINSTVINGLQTKGMLPVPPSINDRDSLSNYITNETRFADSLKEEYCFYHMRYAYALQQLITNLINAYGRTSTNTTTIQTYLTATQNLNQKLNDLTQIINEIAKNYYIATKQLNSSIISTNVQISANIDKLRQQKEVLTSDTGVANLYKKMVDYTGEKTRYSSNLLNLYSFLNIFILGLLVYVYRSSSLA